MRRLQTALALGCLLFASARAVAQAPPTPGAPGNRRAPARDSPAAAVQDGLATFRSLVRPDNFQRFGFASLDEALGELQPEPPFCEYALTIADLDALLAPGTSRLPRRSPLLIYPLSAQGGSGERQVRVSITVARNAQGGWEAVAFGSGVTAATLVARRAELSAQGVPIPRICLARLPVIALRMLAFEEAGTLQFMALSPDPSIDLAAGNVVSIGRLRPALERERKRRATR